MNYNLTASQKTFEAIDPPSEYYIELDDLLNGKYTNKFEGFLIIKNVFSNEIIDSLRNEYFSLFINCCALRCGLRDSLRSL